MSLVLASIYWVLLLATIVRAVRVPKQRVWATFLVGLLAHSLLWNLVDDLGMPVRYGYAAHVDRALGLGHLPTVRLQGLWTGAPGLHDWFFLAVYYSFFGLPLLLVTASRRRNPHLARRLVGAALLNSLVALPVMALVPTAPPWLATARGATEPLVAVKMISQGLTLDDYVAAGTNLVAAMPSLHQATAVICGLTIAEGWPRLRFAGWGYGAAMGVGLVYLGEHYAVDVLAGTVLAVMAWSAVGRLLVRGPTREAVREEAAPALPSVPVEMPAVD